MPKISGIDFSTMGSLRNSVKIVLMNGKEYELPLLPVRLADEADTYLQRNNILAARYVGVQTKINMRAAALTKLQKEIEEDPEKLNTLAQDKNIDTFEATYKTLEGLQEQTAELCRVSNQLCIEIREFIKGFVDEAIIKQLEELEDRMTVRVLELMMYGEDALREPEEVADEEENPSTQASQSN